MFDFANPNLLFLLLGLVVFGGLYYLSRVTRQQRLKRFGQLSIIPPLMPMASKYKPGIKFTCEMIALACLVLVLARPRAGEKVAEERGEGYEVVIAFDVSNSMLASSTDDKNGISRLDRAKLTMEKLVDRLGNDKVGLIVFANEPKVQLPLTTDFSSAKMYLSDLNPKMIANQGTDLAEAMAMAAKAFSQEENVGKTIILLTDAEDHEGRAVEMAKNAAENGIQVNVVGMGTAKGAPIPVNASKGDYLKDREGNVVTTVLNEELGKEIAKAGKGVYVNGASSKAINDLVNSMENTLEKSQIKSVKYKASAEQFPTFAWIALIFLVLDVCLLDRKNGWLTKFNFFNK